MHDRPKARTEQLISERIDDELVIYDQLNHVAHCLSHDAVLVWEHCDGRLTETEIADRLTLSLEVVERAVAALDERGLLDEGPAPRPATPAVRRRSGWPGSAAPHWLGRWCTRSTSEPPRRRRRIWPRAAP